MIRIGVTGTDTGVGKSIVSAALLAMARERGFRVSGMKPIETGVRRGDPTTDAWLLRAAAGGADREELVCPFVLPDPLAPWIAARRAGRAIPLEELDGAFASLGEGRDLVVVEGAGGLLVPITRDVRFDTLFRRWEAELVIVAADRLGVLNHTLLTVQAARSAGLSIRGVVLNASPTEPEDVSSETNRDFLRELIPDLPVITFPRLRDARNVDELAGTAEQSGLARLIPELDTAEPDRRGRP
jgi:dethiobiotin synthetase